MKTTLAAIVALLGIGLAAPGLAPAHGGEAAGREAVTVVRSAMAAAPAQGSASPSPAEVDYSAQGIYFFDPQD